MKSLIVGGLKGALSRVGGVKKIIRGFQKKMVKQSTADCSSGNDNDPTPKKIHKNRRGQ